MRSSGTQALIRKSCARPSSVWAGKAVPSPSRWSERYSTRRQARFQRAAASRSAMAAHTLPTGAAILRDSYVVGILRLPHHHVHQLAGDVDHPRQLPAVRELAHAWARQGELLRPTLVDAGGRLDAVAHLPVYLDDQRDLVLAGELLVPGRPCLRVYAVGAAAARPQLLGDVRRHRRQHQQQRLDSLVPGFAVDRAGVTSAEQAVRHLHQGGKERVEPEALHVLGRLADRLVGEASHLADGVRGRLTEPRFVQGEAPHAVEPAPDAGDPLGAEGAALVPGADEHQVAAEGVGAVAGDVFVRGDDVPARLRHPLAVRAQDLALVEQPQERLVALDHAEVAGDFPEEAGVEQVHDGVLSAAGVLVHGQPGLRALRVDGPGVVDRAEVADEVPVGVHECVHGVRLAASGTAAARAVDVHEPLVPGQRRLAGRLELGVFRQEDGELVLRDGDGAALLAVDDRDGRAPVALAGDQPVADAVGDGASAPALRLDITRDGLLAVLVRHTVEPAGVYHRARVDVGLLQRRAVPVRRRDDHADGDAVLLGELEVALVVGGHAHDGAGAVPEQGVVGGPDLDVLAGEQVLAVGAGEDAGLLMLRGQTLNLRLASGLLHVGLHLGAALRRRQQRHQRVLRRQHHERDAEDRVRPRGEDAQLLLLDARGVQAEGDLHALRAADPVALHRHYPLPPVDAGEVQQLG